MAVLKKAALFFLAFSFLCSTSVFADEASIREEINQLKARITELEQKLSTQEKCMNDQKQCILDQNKKIAEYKSRLTQFDTDLHRQTGTPISIAEGLEIGTGSTMIIQGTSNTNNAAADVRKKEDRTDASYSVDLTIGKEVKEVGGKAFLHLEAGQGNGLEDDLTLYSNVNRDSGDSEENVQVTELWYEQALFDDKAALTFGKLDPTAYFDNNVVANDETTQFLGRIFRNSPAIEFPDNTAGIRLAYMPLEWLEFGYGVFDGNSDWEKIGDNLFNIGQVTVKTTLLNLPGNYRFYGWNNNAYHTKWLDTAKEKEAAYGFGISFDQKVTDNLMLFTRYGWQNPKGYNPDIMVVGDINYSIEQSFSIGLQLEGKLWNRKNDVLAFALGQIIPSDDYKEANNLLAKTEGHLEAYYRIFVTEYLSFSPDVQYIWNAFGKDIVDDTSRIFVMGMRAQVDF